jgi:putative ABC transport system permease protein
LPVDIDSYLDLHKYDPFILDPGQLQAFRSTRTGALVDADLLKKYGWKVGDKIPLHSTIWNKSDGSLDWTFDIVGTFLPKDPALRTQLATALLFHYDYFDEGRTFGKGTVGWFEERVTDPGKSAEIAQKVDALFANSSNETKTAPARDFAMSFIKQQGDITFILRAVIGAVFFTLLFLTGNTMMQSVRERIPELAVLKTLGFSGSTVLNLVLAESLLLCLMAAAVGLALAWAALPVVRQGLRGALLTPSAMLPGFAYATALALIVGAWPALRALRLDVVNALADHR